VGAVVTACQRVGIRSQVQRLSRPHRGERRARRRRRGQRPSIDGATNGDALASEQADVVTAAIDGEAELTHNGGPETSIHAPSGPEVDAGPRVHAPLDPPTGADTPL
jgi:hypothetical protein